MKALKKAIYQFISKRYMNDCSNYNSLATRKGSRSKKQARDTFQQGGIPHAQGQVFINPFVAHRFAQKNGFPLVIKPNVSGFSRAAISLYETTKNFGKLFSWPNYGGQAQ